MHKYFAKTLFLGKKIEFLPECHSTNDELSNRIRNGVIHEGHTIYTDHQISGKGQRGNRWISEQGSNLLFSFYIKPNFLSPKEAFLINILAGLAVIKTISNYTDGKPIELKWPNDIYCDGLKISGILVETGIELNRITSAIVGIGLNVNQSHYHLPTATSLRLISGRSYDREILLEEILICFESYFLKLKGGRKDELIRNYYEVMMWRGESHTFKSNGEPFQGEIIGISEFGKLQVNVNNSIKSFDIKEIEFVE